MSKITLELDEDVARGWAKTNADHRSACPAHKCLDCALLDAINKVLAPAPRVGDVCRSRTNEVWLRLGGRTETVRWVNLRADSVRSDREMTSMEQMERPRINFNIDDHLKALEAGPCLLYLTDEEAEIVEDLSRQAGGEPIAEKAKAARERRKEPE